MFLTGLKLGLGLTTGYFIIKEIVVALDHGTYKLSKTLYHKVAKMYCDDLNSGKMKYEDIPKWIRDYFGFHRVEVEDEDETVGIRFED